MTTPESFYDTWLEDLKRKHPSHVRGGRLNRFVEAVKSNTAFQSVYNQNADRVSASRQAETSDGLDEVDGTPTSNKTESSAEQRLSLLFEAARNGCCTILKQDFFDIKIIDINLTDECGVTALHVAAENGNHKDVKFLLKAGAVSKCNNQGLTPLHAATLSTEPNPKIAAVLIKNMTVTLVNATISRTSNNEPTEGNTALHCAAENIHISREFIQALNTCHILDPSIKNNAGKTAFHIAAETENPDIIVAMLEVFTPAKSGWEMAGIETDNGPTLLEICAKKGNAKAVALLIKFGANKTRNRNIFFSLIDESVNNPMKTDKLIGVYHTITEHCVLWNWLSDNSDKPTAPKEHYPRRTTEPKAYAEKQREIMLDLLTKSNEGYEDRNVLEHAIVKGDRSFLNEIVNTPDVFRMTDSVPASKDKSKDVTYDVTGFLNLPIFQNMCSKKSNAVEPAPENEQSTHKKPTRPSYLRLIAKNRRLWENTDILQLEPFHTITKPMCSFVQLIYLAMAAIQLLHMILFSIWYMPSYCSLKQKLNRDVSVECNFSAIPPEPLAVSVSPFSTAVNLLWLVWPTAVWFATVIVRFPDRKWVQIMYGYLSVRLLYAPVLWAWYFTTFVRQKLYLSLMSLAHLLGWLVTLSFVISTLENASIFSFLLKDIIVKDIAFNFGIVFLFIVVSFSSAIHLLRESALLGQTDYSDTMYNVFASALTTGDFMSETTLSTDAVARYHLLQAIFALYLCCATIILLNVLITMMNNRYEEAKRKARNSWRFQTVHSYLYFGFNLTNTLDILSGYWRITTHKYWKQFVNTKYDEVYIEESGNGDKVLLHLK